MTSVTRIRELVKRNGSFKALTGSTPNCQTEVLKFPRPNGEGKSTPIRVILGSLRADSGHVWLLGRDPGGAPTSSTDEWRTCRAVNLSANSLGPATALLDIADSAMSLRLESMTSMSPAEFRPTIGRYTQPWLGSEPARYSTTRH